EMRAWTAQMKQRADSALAAIRGGATLEAIAEPLGGIRKNLVVTPDNFPGSWPGGARLDASIFHQAPGTVLTEPVPAASGWLIARVEEVEPERIASLAEATPDIRAALRADRRAHSEEPELRAMD